MEEPYNMATMEENKVHFLNPLVYKWFVQYKKKNVHVVAAIIFVNTL